MIKLISKLFFLVFVKAENGKKNPSLRIGKLLKSRNECP